MLAPVVLFVYNREKHTEATLEALKKNKLASESELFIFSDGAKTKDDSYKVEKVRRVLRNYEAGKDFKKIEITEAETNQGLAASVILGVTKIISKYGKVIVLEDDIVAAPLFLTYMNKALQYYENNEKIWSVSGYTLEMDSLKKYSKQVYFGYRASSWGWGTWKDRWELVDWEMKDYTEFENNAEARKKFNRGGKDMCKMLESQMQGKIDSWAIRWCYHQSKRDMLTVFPAVSFVANIGCDGSGTHSGEYYIYDTKINENVDLELDKGFFLAPFLEPKIVKEFSDIYSRTLKIRIRNKIKAFKGRLKYE